MKRVLPDICDVVSLGTSSGNVIQGFCVTNDLKYLLSIHKYGASSGSETNIITKASVLNPALPLDNTSGFGAGHGQVLIPLSDGTFCIEGSGDGELLRVYLNLDTMTFTQSADSLVLFSNADTDVNMTGSFDGENCIFRCVENGNEGTVKVFSRTALEAAFDSGSAPTPIHTFESLGVTDSSDWFQALFLHNGHAYSVTGNGDISATPKKLTRYKLDGSSYTQKNLDYFLSEAQSLGSKREPEGSFIVNGNVYLSFMLGSSGNNKKYIVNAKEALRGF